MSAGQPEATRTRTGLAWRRAVVLSLPVLYIAGSAARAGEAHAAWLAVTLGLGVAVVGAIVPGSDPPPVARARLWTAGTLAVALATAGLFVRPWAVLLRDVASLGAGLFAIRALFTMEPDPGLAPRATEATAPRGFGLRELERYALVSVAVAWGSAAFVDALAVFHVGSSPMAPFAATTSGIVALASMGTTSLLVAGARRFELGPPPRALACAAVSAAGLLGGTTLALVSPVRVDASIALGAAAVAAAFVAVAQANDPLRLARCGRRAIALIVFGGPLVAVAAIAARASSHQSSGLVVLFLALGALLVGVSSPRLERLFLPVKGALVGALERSRHIAHDRDARAAIAEILLTLRDASGYVARADHPAVSAELWMLHPARVYMVDAASYLHEHDAELPPYLLDVAKNEPNFTVRVDVLRALEVRRADLRPLLRWLESRGALFATLIAEEEEAEGVLLVPAGTRAVPLVIDEIHRAKLLADTFVAICQARNAQARHLARERELVARVEALEDDNARLRYAAELNAGRNELASAHLARPAAVGIYSAASRMAYDAIEQRLARDAPVVVVARAGVDPVPTLARAYLAGPRKNSPLVVADGTSSSEHDRSHWGDARTSPLALANGGLLVLADGAALPHEVQAFIARALTARRAPWDASLDIAIALTTATAPEHLVDEGRLAPELFRLFESAPTITLPGLHERSEDLFSIVADRLAREGLRVRGRPIGIEAAAFARLVEYPFDGGDAELTAIVTRLVAHVDGDVVRAADIDILGLRNSPAQSNSLAQSNLG
ncbi:MAG: hypothetical protein FWD69_05030 [Polyangiaceae bacterium]|nr:hypothetical protein [Polyangiaceae bacterium]